MRLASLGTVTSIVLGTFVLAAAPGCESTDGKVVDRDQTQTTNPNGSQTRQRTQVRQTSDGKMVRETETQTREPVSGDADTAGSTDTSR